MNAQDSLFNKQLLKEIAHLRKLKEMNIKSERIPHCLEMLRFVRNTVLDQEFEEGLIQENEWIQKQNENKGEC